jgi:hypothetical protein
MHTATELKPELMVSGRQATSADELAALDAYWRAAYFVGAADAIVAGYERKLADAIVARRGPRHRFARDHRLDLDRRGGMTP